MLERRTQQARLLHIACRHQRGGVLALMQADSETIVAQVVDKRGKASRDETRDLVEFFVFGIGAAAAHATFPNRRSLTSRVTRDLSSWVLSRHIRVSCTVSGASCRSRTSSPTKAAARSRVAPQPA